MAGMAQQPGEIIYDERARWAARWGATLLVSAAGALPCAVGALAVDVFGLPVQWHGYLLAGLLLLTMLTWGSAVAVAPLLGNTTLKARIAAKIAQQPGGEDFVSGAHFVGFAPTAELFQWDGDTDWDVGFLKIAGDTLAFWGDRCRWTLPKSSVLATRVAQAPDVPRIVIRWGQGELGGVVSITAREGKDTSQARQETLAIADAVGSWLSSENGREGPRWGWPPTQMDAPGGRPVAEIGLTGCIGILAALAIAVTTCLLVAMPVWTAGLKALAVMRAIAVGWPLLMIISELAMAGR